MWMSDGSPAHTILQTGATALYAQNGHVRAVVAAKAEVNIQNKVRFTACLLIII